MAQTTLKRIREHSPCDPGWKKLLRYLGKTQADDEPLSLMTVLESNGLDDALWCLQACDGIDRKARLFAVWCVRQVQHLLTDSRSLAALDMAERHALGQATDDDLRAACDAAQAAARAVAWDAAWDAAYAAVKAAAMDASWDVARAASQAAAFDAAHARAARAAQAAEFRKVFG